MLPLIASDPTFISSTLEILEAVNYANSGPIRANLLDALRCWLSHTDEVLAKYESFEEKWDKIASNSTKIAYPLALTSDAEHLDPRRLLVELRALEADLSYHDQFLSLPLLACVRVLKQIKEAAPLLAALDAKLDQLRFHQAHIVSDMRLLETVAEYFCYYAPPKPRALSWPAELAVVDPLLFPEGPQRTALEAKIVELQSAASSALATTRSTSGSCVNAITAGSAASPSPSPSPASPPRKAATLVPTKANPPRLSDVWAVEDLTDMLPPLFSSVRALWVCSERFGAKNDKAARFCSITRAIIHRVELSVHAGCWDAVQSVVDNATAKNTTRVKAIVVSAQESIVALQEAFYGLKAHLADVGPSTDGFHLVYADLDDTLIFANVEWQYRRLTGVLEVVDNLRSNPKKIGSKLTEPFEVPSANADVMSRAHFPDAAFTAASRALLSQDAPDPDLIIQSIANKEADRQRALLERQPRYPLGLLTSHLTIVCSFGPPTVTVVGGPLSLTTLDALQTRLPLCCANKIPDAKHSKLQGEMMTFSAVPNPTGQHVWRLVIPEQYCETSLHVVAFVHTVLTAVEGELCWNLCGTHALFDADFGETHYYIFKKFDPTADRVRRGGPAAEALEAAKAELAELEK